MTDADRGPLTWEEMAQLGGLTLPWQPHAKKRPKISAPRAGRRPRTHQDPEDKAAEERTREHVRAQMGILGLPMLTGNVKLVARFYRQSRQVVDYDNLLKHLSDSLNGVAFADDSQVTYCVVQLELDRNQPRTEFYVVPSVSTMKRGTDAV